jgi:hypothetical protein
MHSEVLVLVYAIIYAVLQNRFDGLVPTEETDENLCLSDRKETTTNVKVHSG